MNMKKILAVITTAGTLFMANAALAEDGCWIYQHTNGGGTVHSFEGGENVSSLSSLNFNDEASSVKIAEGYLLAIFQHDNYGGKYRTFGEGTFNLTNVGMIHSFWGWTYWNDQASSIRCKKK
ncbi:peptidase inhibitor family I36 protein [Agaribacterium haliotis]|uniref:peptidase inhibitor family I36 protein n=1 Tax=Agaribacterium haliotis TaxID=2013869 RepID=UPI001178236E|nr:peptidase inhibitor family I36 protein [Agaribacterium haliotis]